MAHGTVHAMKYFQGETSLKYNCNKVFGTNSINNDIQ